MKTLWPYLRIATALLALAALARQLTREIASAQAATTEWGRDIPTAVSNFFSFFTTLSGLIAAVTLLIGAAWMLRTKAKNDTEPRWLAVLFTFASTYMITTGIVYNVLLRSIPSHSATEQWTSETLHIVLPIVMLLDVLFAPRRHPLGWTTAFLAVILPLAWGAYTLIRGPFITDPFTATPYWYPYPFLNPQTSSWLSVGIYIAVIAFGILVLASIVVWIGRLRGRPLHWPSEAT
ncbi:Pr6Pr family membrane protein [Microbacterium sp. NPDC008134]|uniref:Pr6Pr family membrane protein n=1 Tax=Microbacterium sp. NPDC008134 TaxID=3364183 RepID=UPI0036EEB96C